MIFMLQLYHTEHFIHNENIVSYVLIQRFHFLCALYKDHLHLLQTADLKGKVLLRKCLFSDVISHEHTPCNQKQ